MIDAARDQGWRVEFTGSNHLRFLSRDRSVSPVYGPYTPSDHRSIKNLITKLRHAGLADV